MNVPKAPSAMMPVGSRYGVQHLMPHYIPINNLTESVLVSDAIVEEILGGNVPDSWIKYM